MTNSNIRTHALEGAYSGGAIKFYYITKNAIIDFGHLRGSYGSWYPGSSYYNLESVKTSLYSTERAGNCLENAKSIGTAPYNNSALYIDYANDVDCYCFTVSSSGTKAIQLISNVVYDVRTTLYDNNGNALYSITSPTGCTYKNIYLTTGTTYYLKVEFLNMNYHPYNYKYQVSIT